RVTVSLVRDGSRIHVLRVEPSDGTVRNYGIAVDIGTTTVAVQLVSLEVGKIIATHSNYNDQISCGLDVISRINYARQPERREELRVRVLKTINGLIKKATGAHSVSPSEICNAVISGNTTMLHLLLGLNPEYIRLEPYTPTIMKSLHLTAAEVGVEINPDSWVCLSPCVGSYVGGDITAGLLCTDLATDSAEVNLFIDIGTNGEIVIGNNEFLMACACSAGPAFEGGGIDCGMRAALGAIERVEVDPATGVCRKWTVGDTKPVGICGSGMIALLADLFITGWIDSAGKLNRGKPSPAIEISGRNAFYVVATAEESGTGKTLRISESDIENIIRTKAAIYSACALMLKQVEMTFDDLTCIYIAGGFGRFLDLDKATVLGLIPDLPREKFKYIGNSSLMGSYMTLVSRDYYQRQIELANRMTYIELSTDPTYMDQYTAALFLPHTDAALFPTVKPKK
ncbi:MAG: ASKHA domain-containing protein, partial [Kiritimatiellales bacterium]